MIILDYLFYSIYMGTEKTYGEGSIFVTCNLMAYNLTLFVYFFIEILKKYGIDLWEIFPELDHPVFSVCLYLLIFGSLYLNYTINDRYQKAIDRFFYLKFQLSPVVVYILYTIVCLSGIIFLIIFD